MGDVTAFRRRGPGAPAAGGSARGSAEQVAGEPVTIATLIARAFGVREEPGTVRGTTPPGPVTPGAPVRHLHLVRETPAEDAAR